MQLSVHFSGADRRAFGNHDYEGVLRQSLERFGRRLVRVCLYIEDTNGPRGGEDKQCRCVLHLRRMQPVVIKDRDDNLLSLLYRVANRAAHTLSRRSDRRAKRVRQHRRGYDNALSGLEGS